MSSACRARQNSHDEVGFSAACFVARHTAAHGPVGLAVAATLSEHLTEGPRP